MCIVCMCVCMYIHAGMRMYACAYVRMHVSTYLRMCVCPYVRIVYVRVYVCMYIWMGGLVGGGDGWM